MANRRMISKRISISKRVNAIPIFSRLLFTWIIPHTDDWGRLDGDPEKIKAMIMPLSKRPVKDFDKSLEEMAKVGLIVWYAVDNSLYLQIVNFEDHQSKLEKRTHSKFPNPPLKNESDENGWRYSSPKFAEVRRSSPKFALNLTKPNLTKPNLTYTDDFNEVWNKYPRRLGKEKAFTQFRASVKDSADLEALRVAVGNYAAYVKKEQVEERYIQHGSTFFHNWRDWVDYKFEGGKEKWTPERLRKHLESLPETSGSR